MIALVRPAYILFLLCYIQYNEVQHMREMPPRMSEHLPFMQVTPYHPHNSVNLPRDLLHCTLLLLLGGATLYNLYIHWTAIMTTVPVASSNFNQPIEGTKRENMRQKERAD